MGKMEKLNSSLTVEKGRTGDMITVTDVREETGKQVSFPVGSIGMGAGAAAWSLHNDGGLP